jgi:hypothetical protein
MATLQERIREYLGSQADTPAARNIAQQAEAGYGEALGAALGAPAGAAVGAVAGRGATTPAEREYLNSVLNQTRQGPGANVPRMAAEGVVPPVASPDFGPLNDTPAGRQRGMGSYPVTPNPNDPRYSLPEARSAMPDMAGRGMDTPQERQALRDMMTPQQRDQYFQSFADEGLNLTPGAGLARGLRGIDQAVTNATTAPGNLGENQLQNIAGGNAYNAQGQINPYGLGLGQQMYNPMGLLNF